RETQTILDALPDNVRLLQQTNAELSAARNAGFRDSTTPLVLALDADDMLASDALQVLKHGLANDHDAGFSYGVTHFFGDWSKDMTMPGWDPYQLLYRHTIGPTALTRRELFDNVGGYDPEILGYKNWEFWLHALTRGWHSVKVEQITFLYHQHSAT